MRLGRLDLVRYGKFTDRSIELVANERDFHVVVGPNEAGKSTIRSAIHDLLYGIPGNTSHGFLHAMPDMRIGAKIEHAGNALEFLRAKGNKHTLRDLQDKPLADGALASYLGPTDKAFFSQMFGLDHVRLVEGGSGILSASNDLGQILFQSAAGIANFGEIRQALEAEADKLWSKRRSGERAYYVASDQLDQASSDLKAATVRSKAWAEVNDRVDALEREQKKLKDDHLAVRKRRVELERIRRVLPHLNAIDEATSELEGLGPFSELPVTAAKTLADAERAITTAETDMGHQAAILAEAQAQLDGLSEDGGLLALTREITALSEERHRFSVYEVHIQQREAEVEAQWQIALNTAASIGWDKFTEEALRTQLPTMRMRTVLTRLIAAHVGLQQEVKAAERAESQKRAEIDLTKERLDALPPAELPVSLQAALALAQRLGDTVTVLRDRQESVQQLQGELERAHQALGKWRVEPAQLRGMTVPVADFIKSLEREETDGDAQGKTLAARSEQLQHQVKAAQLDLTQYQRAHDTVTREELLAARTARDELWSTIRVGATELVAHREEFEQHVSESDVLADRRHDTAQETSELLSKQSLVERYQQELDAVAEQIDELLTATQSRALQWQDVASRCGMPNLPFQAATQWIDARQLALDAEQALATARLSFETTEASVMDAICGLENELAKVGISVTDEPLDVLVRIASEHLNSITDARGQRRTLDKQLADAEQATSLLEQESQAATEALKQWRGSWDKELMQAGLAADSDMAFVEELLTASVKIESALDDMAKKRVERIDAMRSELEGHREAARAIASRIATDLLELHSFKIADELFARLSEAKETAQARQRHRGAIDAAQKKHDEAELKRDQAQALLTPLLQRAGVTSNLDLEVAIASSDRRRALEASLATNMKAFREASDGVALEQLRADLALVDVSTLGLEVDELTRQDETFVSQLTELAGKRQAADTALNAIVGAAQAAVAEGKRQEALAKMTDVVERYVKVHTAARLLQWSIERYREEKQGPMLRLASDIFRRLTSGSFEKLTVDFYSKPVKLLGQRPAGTYVDVDGMSEGTRDQLYLALRLAALDLHLDHAHALPFIADDLFINYDDARSKAGLEALGELSRKTQVIFLTHHDHLLPAVHDVFGERVNVVTL